MNINDTYDSNLVSLHKQELYIYDKFESYIRNLLDENIKVVKIKILLELFNQDYKKLYNLYLSITDDLDILYDDYIDNIIISSLNTFKQTTNKKRIFFDYYTVKSYNKLNEIHLIT